MSKPKLALIPSGYKSGKVYSILPNDATGDFDYERNGNASRVRKDGLIEELTVDDTPRLDWYNSNCPSLLLEPQRSNIQLRSEEFDNAVWSKVNASITANQIVAPNGEYTADQLTATASSLSTYVYEQHSLSTSTDYSMSVFVKKGTSNLVRLDLEDFTSGTQGRMTFNLNTKEITNEVGTASYEDYGNGWYRLKVSFTTSATLGIHYLRIWDFETVNGAYFYLWGAQIEEGSYCSSYIKTEASTVTRLKDECLNGGDSDLFDITEGTFFADITPYDNEGANTTYILLSDGSTLNRIIFIFYGNLNQVRFFLSSNASGSTVNYLSHYQSISFNQKNKLAFTFKKDELKCYANGSLVHTISSALVPINLESLDFSTSAQNSSFFEGKVHDTRVYDRVLTEAEAIELTTL